MISEQIAQAFVVGCGIGLVLGLLFVIWMICEG